MTDGQVNICFSPGWDVVAQVTRRSIGAVNVRSPERRLAPALPAIAGTCYRSAMRIVTARDANQSFSKLLAEAEQGETFVITKNGQAVAELRPRAHDPRDDPQWRADFEAMLALMDATPATGYRVGEITSVDKYGDAG
jgi:prevent-host-death family protein